MFGLCSSFCKLSFLTTSRETGKDCPRHQVFSKQSSSFYVLLLRKASNRRTLTATILASRPWIQMLLDAWHSSLIYLLPCRPAAGSQALRSGHVCSWAKPLHMLQHTGPSMLLSYLATAWTCMSVQVLPICIVQVNAELMLFTRRWIDFNWWLCVWGAALPCL